MIPQQSAYRALNGARLILIVVFASLYAVTRNIGFLAMLMILLLGIVVSLVMGSLRGRHDNSTVRNE